MVNRDDVTNELREAQGDFHQLVDRVDRHALSGRADGTWWTNRQLLFHMVFGYIIVRTLMPLVHVLGRLGWSHRGRRYNPLAHGCCGGAECHLSATPEGPGDLGRPERFAGLLAVFLDERAELWPPVEGCPADAGESGDGVGGDGFAVGGELGAGHLDAADVVDRSRCAGQVVHPVWAAPSALSSTSSRAISAW